MKKAQGISMNVVIIAALALLVLVVLSVIFLTKTSLFTRELVNCRQQGGVCAASSDACPETNPITYNQWKCLRSDNTADPDQKCCIAGAQ